MVEIADWDWLCTNGTWQQLNIMKIPNIYPLLVSIFHYIDNQFD